jgi:lipid A ethanolaminephosphotransferase
MPIKKEVFLKRIKKITPSQLVILTSVFLTLFYNFAFFSNTIKIYPISLANIPFLGSIAVIFTLILIFVITLISSRYILKPFLIFILMMSSVTNYFMNAYNIIFDTGMLQNVIETNIDESLDLLSVKLVLHVFLLGVLPSLFIYTVKIKNRPLKTELFSKLKIIIFSLLITGSLLLTFNRFYTSFFREHKPLRYYANPTGWISAVYNCARESLSSGTTIVIPIGTDAKISSSDTDRELIILVVGEAVRADRISLNGYYRETTPLLAKEDVISFTNMYSCGTSTAVSVPCMFSVFPRKAYSKQKAKSSENLLDVLQYAGVNILWRENNSSSKGTALRVPYEDFRHADNNPMCDDGKCRDEGMLVGLQDHIDSIETGDIFIILHQMGNHGPAYYKRYPKAFEKFTPVCKTNQLEECTSEEIGNAYDNAVLYTDYFLSKTIRLLKQNTDHFETAMIYFSDHGESLGEMGLYLHGLPYAMAPDEQKHIGTIMWFGDSFKIDKTLLNNKSANAFSQDNLFHTILGLMEIETEVYDQNLDMINYGE